MSMKDKNKLKELEDEIKALNAEKSDLKETVAEQLTTITTLRTSNTALKATVKSNTGVIEELEDNYLHAEEIGFRKGIGTGIFICALAFIIARLAGLF